MVLLINHKKMLTSKVRVDNILSLAKSSSHNLKLTGEAKKEFKNVHDKKSEIKFV